MTHTPGPWQVSGGRNRQDAYGHTVGPDGFGIACVFYCDRTTADHIASLHDARLIAAAPELLDYAMKQEAELRVLRGLVAAEYIGKAIHTIDQMLKNSTAAIAKAEGRS